MFSGRIVIALKVRRGAKARVRVLIIRRLVVVRLRTTRRVTVAFRLPANVQKAVRRALAARLRVTLTVSGVLSATGAKSGSARLTVRMLR